MAGALVNRVPSPRTKKHKKEARNRVHRLLLKSAENTR